MMKPKCLFYFTYDADKEKSGHPYSGGWSIVEAPDMGSACQIFNVIHPEKVKNKPRYRSCICSEVWGETIMAQQGHNHGKTCHEKISWEVFDER